MGILKLRTKIYITSASILFVMLFGSLTGCQTAATTTKESEYHLAGGWYAGEVNKEVRQAALFARKELNKAHHNIQKIDDIQQQIVAGVNYQFTMLLADNSKYQLKVYLDLENKYHLLECKQVN